MSIAEPPANPVLGPRLNGTLMTPQEFDAAQEYDEDFTYELVHGVLVVNPIPSAEETDPNEELGRWLRNYKEEHPNGSVLDATMPQQYVRTRSSRRLADRVLWIGLGRLPDRRRDLPTIAVEFVSAARRDRRRDYVDKRQEYMEVGLAEYWIIDRFQRTLTVVRQGPAEPTDEIIHESGVYRPALLPGFELPLGKLPAIADRWAESDR